MDGLPSFGRSGAQQRRGQERGASFDAAALRDQIEEAIDGKLKSQEELWGIRYEMKALEGLEQRIEAKVSDLKSEVESSCAARIDGDLADRALTHGERFSVGEEARAVLTRYLTWLTGILVLLGGGTWLLIRSEAQDAARGAVQNQMKQSQELLSNASAALLRARSAAREATQSSEDYLAAKRQAEKAVQRTQKLATELEAKIARAAKLLSELEGKIYDLGTRADLISRELTEQERQVVEEARAENPDKLREGTSKLWAPGATIRVAFLEGSEELRAKARRAARRWLEYAHLRFDYVDDAAGADVRISFKKDGASWSYLGTDCLGIPKSEATMNLGLIEEDESSTLHEFGHLLGLQHEHQNPDADLKWDEDALYQRLTGPPQYWTRSTVHYNVLKPWKREALPFAKPFDRESIMMYRFPASDFLDGKALVGGTKLSEKDKAFVARLYPKPR